jgi:methyl-accepting chemotaxis protein
MTTIELERSLKGNLLNRLSFRSKVIIYLAVFYSLPSIIVGGIVSFLIWDHLNHTALDNQAIAMKIAWLHVTKYGTNFSVDNNQLYIDSYRVNDTFEIVDSVKEIVGGTCTIFLGDTRVSTNVLREDGSRALGTKLDPTGPAYDAIFNKGKSYLGEVDILGVAYYAQYDPIYDARGKIIGVLYVGTKKSELLGVFYHLILYILGSIIITDLLTCKLSKLASRYWKINPYW